MSVLRLLAVFGLAILSPITAMADPAEKGAALTSTEIAATETVAPASVETAAPVSSSSTVPADSTPASTEPAPAAAASPPPPPAPLPEPTMTVSVDLAAQQMVVSENGTAQYTWPISSGTAQFPTPRGTFRPQWTAKMWYSRKYDMAPMPNAVFINGGVAVHATYHTNALGQPASHGCIRLSPANAKTFYNLVHRHGLKKVKVAIYGTPKWRSPAVAQRKLDSQRQYAAAQDSFWFWGNSYADTSAYDPAFTKKKYRNAKRPYYAQPQPRTYRRYNGQRYVYVQRPSQPYNNNGNGPGW